MTLKDVKKKLLELKKEQLGWLYESIAGRLDGDVFSIPPDVSQEDLPKFVNEGGEAQQALLKVLMAGGSYYGEEVSDAFEALMTRKRDDYWSDDYTQGKLGLLAELFNAMGMQEDATDCLRWASFNS